MTVITLTTNDQKLTVTQKPLLASGDVNSVILHVDFDAAWDGYIARTAVFHTSKDSTEYEKLLTNGECMIPDEVLVDAGTLFIGVRGVPVDGSAVKTSSLVKYKIVEGASPGTYTIQVTPDIYQQYIAAMKEQIDPVSTQIREDFDVQMATWDADVEELKSRIMVTKTYTGDGNTTRTHTFDFPVRFLYITMDSWNDSNWRLVAVRGQSKASVYETASNYGGVSLEWDENTVTISQAYNTNSDAYTNDRVAMNKDGETYWIAAFA